MLMLTMDFCTLLIGVEGVRLLWGKRVKGRHLQHAEEAPEPEINRLFFAS